VPQSTAPARVPLIISIYPKIHVFQLGLLEKNLSQNKANVATYYGTKLQKQT
jgi:hypothetical protein